MSDNKKAYTSGRSVVFKRGISGRGENEAYETLTYRLRKLFSEWDCRARHVDCGLAERHAYKVCAADICNAMEAVDKQLGWHDKE